MLPAESAKSDMRLAMPLPTRTRFSLDVTCVAVSSGFKPSFLRTSRSNASALPEPTTISTLAPVPTMPDTLPRRPLTAASVCAKASAIRRA
ncbi:Uncharacterised protein [uncultured archaeon]|nr:Uncharacterised protein [uncultured archaeon]